MATNVPARRASVEEATPATRLTRFLLDLVSDIPRTAEHRTPGPDERARAIAAAASNRAALTAGTLALPPGAFGWITLLPELYAIWRIQAQMVADIAGAYGVSAELRREQMIYCLFRHAMAQAVRDLAVQVGGRILIQEVPLRLIERIAAKIGIGVSRRLVGRGITRWVPVIGACGVGLYARYDTAQVARTAIALFADAAQEKAAEPDSRTP
jgi:hypothetical protein